MTNVIVTKDGGGNVTGVFQQAQSQLSSQVVADSDAAYVAFLAAQAAVIPETMKGMQLLFIIRAADMHITTDQQFTKVFSGTLYKPTHIFGKRVSGGASVACLGGVYTAASKGGDALVASTQSWINLTADKKIVNASLAALVDTDLHTETPYLALSTGSTAACGADIYIFGVVMD